MFLSQDSRAEVDEGAEVVEEVCEELHVAVALEEEHHEEGGEVRREEEEADEDEDNEMAHSILSVISFTCGSCKSFKAARFLYFNKRLLKIKVNTTNCVINGLPTIFAGASAHIVDRVHLVLGW